MNGCARSHAQQVNGRECRFVDVDGKDQYERACDGERVRTNECQATMRAIELMVTHRFSLRSINACL